MKQADELIPIEVFSNYFAGSLLGLLTWWLENGMPYPPEQMADMYRKLFFDGARQVLTAFSRKLKLPVVILAPVAGIGSSSI
jgi:hypothetical protein